MKRRESSASILICQEWEGVGKVFCYFESLLVCDERQELHHDLDRAENNGSIGVREARCDAVNDALGLLRV